MPTDPSGGLLLQFGSALLQINDRDSDLDVVVVVSEDVTHQHFSDPYSGNSVQYSMRFTVLS
jgi:poly(A) polymerase Pap1